MAKKILVVLTSADKMGNEKPGSDKPTGWYVSEFSHPYHVLAAKGVTFATASPAGGVAPVDPASVEACKEDSISVSFLADQKALFEATARLSALDPAATAEEYDAIYYPGGHGVMYDLPTDQHSIALIREFAARGKPIAAVCHGPAAFVNVTLADGTHLLKGRAYTGFSDAEEEAMKLDKVMPFPLETRLNEVSGGGYVKIPELFGENIVVDGNILTGQNPSSAMALGEVIAGVLGV